MVKVFNMIKEINKYLLNIVIRFKLLKYFCYKERNFAIEIHIFFGGNILYYQKFHD